MIEINLKNLILAITFISIFAIPIITVLAFSTLSLDKVDFSSNDKYLNGPAWILTISEDGNSQYAEGIIDKDRIKSSDGATAKNDLTIKTDVKEKSCDYDLKRNYDPNIYKFDIQKVESNAASWTAQDALEDCKDRSNFYWAFLAETGWIFTWDVYCITRDKVGVPGTIKTPVTNFQTELSITADGDTEKATISSIDQTSVRLSNIGYAKWTGSLSSGEQCPDIAADGYNIIHNENGEWIINKKTYYNQYISYKDIGYDELEKDVIKEIENSISKQVSSTSLSDLKNTITKLNSKATDATEEFGYSGFKVSSNNLADGQAKLELSRLIQYPVITMHVKADWLGVVVPVGKPDIVSTSTEKFEEGRTGYITVNVKNVGDGVGSFGVSATCDSPFKQSGITQTVSKLSPGKTSSVKVPITATTNQEISKYCTVKAYDLNNPNNDDSKRVKVTSYPISLCDPGDERCDDSTLLVCNSAGSAWKEVDSDKCVKLACVKDSQCDDGDSCTKDYCDSGKCQNTCQESDKCECAKVCEYVKDGKELIKTLSPEDCCEAQGGRFIPANNPPWWKFWQESTPSKCLIPKISIAAILIMVIGGVLFFTPIGAYGAIPIVIGAMLFLLRLLGY